MEYIREGTMERSYDNDGRKGLLSSVLGAKRGKIACMIPYQ